MVQCPIEFQAELILKNGSIVKGKLSTEALYNDTIYFLTRSYPRDKKSINLMESKENRNHLKVVAILTYLLHDPIFQNLEIPESKVYDFLFNHLKPYTRLVGAHEFLNHPDRQEELCRLLVKYLSILPEGETQEYFSDRMSSLDSVEREAIIQKTIKAQKAAKRKEEELLEAMRRKEAEEAASKMPRE